MENVKMILALKTQAEAIFMREVLEKEQIPHHIRSSEDSAYKQLWKSDGPAYAYIEAPEEYKTRIKDLYNDVKNAKTQPIDESEIQNQPVELNTSRNFKTLLIAILVLLFLFFLFRNYQQRQELGMMKYYNAAFAGTQQFDIENHDEKGIVTGTYKGTHIIGFIGHDADRNAVFEKQEYFSKDGSPAKTLTDEDQNGIPEKITIYGKETRKTYHDKDQNRIIDALEAGIHKSSETPPPAQPGTASNM